MMGSDIEKLLRFSHILYSYLTTRFQPNLQNNKRYESFIFSRINDKFNYKQYVI